MTKLTALEEKFAHLEKTVEDLSEVVRLQSTEIDHLTKLTGAMAKRLRENADQGTGGVIFGDERPPHY
mgnify:CR=1 FL=1